MSTHPREEADAQTILMIQNLCKVNPHVASQIDPKTLISAATKDGRTALSFTTDGGKTYETDEGSPVWFIGHLHRHNFKSPKWDKNGLGQYPSYSVTITTCLEDPTLSIGVQNVVDAANASIALKEYNDDEKNKNKQVKIYSSDILKDGGIEFWCNDTFWWNETKGLALLPDSEPRVRMPASSAPSTSTHNTDAATPPSNENETSTASGSQSSLTIDADNQDSGKRKSARNKAKAPADGDGKEQGNAQAKRVAHATRHSTPPQPEPAKPEWTPRNLQTEDRKGKMVVSEFPQLFDVRGSDKCQATKWNAMLIDELPPNPIVAVGGLFRVTPNDTYKIKKNFDTILLLGEGSPDPDSAQPARDTPRAAGPSPTKKGKVPVGTF